MSDLPDIDHMYAALGQGIKRSLNTANLTYYDAATLLGFSEGAIQAWIRGSRHPQVHIPFWIDHITNQPYGATLDLSELTQRRDWPYGDPLPEDLIRKDPRLPFEARIGNALAYEWAVQK